MGRIGLTMIARGAAHTLPACLASVRNHVDPIVIVLAGRPTDDTEEVAYQYTDHVYWWDKDLLPDGGIADFAAARNFSLEKFAELTGPDHWFLWIDADDTVDDPQNLLVAVAQAEAKRSQGVWLPYMYAFLPDGTCTTLFERERLLYNPTNFFWQNRVHEIIVPKREVHWTRTDKVVIRHNHLAGGNRANRNLTLLRMMREENPDDKRVLFYLGHQHFANGEWAEAARWYGCYVEVADNQMEQWQAYVYMAKALRKLERYEEALAAGFVALGMAPEWRDAWYDVAESYAYRQEWERCLLFAEMGHQRQPAPRIVFVNPLDEVGWNVGMFEELSLFQLGELDKALAKVKELQLITNSQYLIAKRETYEDFAATRDNAEAWLGVLAGMAPERAVDVSKHMSRRLHAIPEIRDAVHGARLTEHRRQAHGGKHVAFYCGPSLEAWAPPKVNEGGIGGSETALVEIARRFANDGWTVDVFNDCGKWEGTHQSVNYWHHSRFPKSDPYDLLVSWRQGRLSMEEGLGAKRIWLWAHDLHYGPDRLPAVAAEKFERVLGVSQFHADYLRDLVYHELLKDHPGVDFVPNGVNLERFAIEGLKRQRHRVVWLSSPDRGLDVMCSLWPHVREAEPQAELHVFYGFDNIEKLARSVPNYANFLQAMRAHMQKPGIVERGRVGQATLAEELLQASVWAYPSTFLETFGISAVESMAAGVPVLATRVGALPEVVGDAGMLVPGHARSDPFLHRFLGCLLALILDHDTWQKYHERGLERAKLWTWDRAYEKWQRLWEDSHGV